MLFYEMAGGVLRYVSYNGIVLTFPSFYCYHYRAILMLQKKVEILVMLYFITESRCGWQ